MKSSLRRHYYICLFLALSAIIGIIAGSSGLNNALADNVTTNNVTLNSVDLAAISVTLQSETTAFNDTILAVKDDFHDFTVNFIIAFFVLSMIVIALWQKDPFIYVVGFLITFSLSIAWFKTFTVVSLALIALSFYFLYYRAIVPLFVKIKRKGEKRE